MIARRILVSGRVQGVGFRYFIIRAAERLGVIGWTRNLADGRVEVVAQAAPETLEVFQEEIARGPRAALVRDLAVTEERLDPDLVGFDVRY